jgi:glycosyltransferase involved in cell wall biosynthesis
MSRRLALRTGQVTVIYNGINLDGYADIPPPRLEERDRERRPSLVLDPKANERQQAPVLGFFARMCPEKGLDTLIEAFITLKQRNRIAGLTLRVGGSCGPVDETFVATLRKRLAGVGVLDHVTFHPNIERSAKIGFLRGLNVLSVPARYGEAFGLYVIEALAAGVPVVQPRLGAFPELVEATGGGLLCNPDDPVSLADALETLLLNPEKARAHGEAGRQAVFERFTARAMAHASLDIFGRAIARSSAATQLADSTAR